MKKTIKINISGIVFHIDEDAYVILSNYLDSVNKHFASDKEGKEIISDIEYRIAELLQMKLNEQKQVINIDDIKEIVEIMGNPEQFEAEEEEKVQAEETTSSRRLYRDDDRRIIGGVCAGIAAYFNIDPIIVRALFLIGLVVYGSPVLIYLILWIVIPPAQTTAQKLEMRGADVSITNIEKSVKEEMENVKEGFKRVKKSKEYNKSKEFANNVGKGLGDIILFFVRFILVIIGVAFVLAGLGIVAGLFGAAVFSEPFFFWSDLHVHNTFLPEIVYHFLTPETAIVAGICVLLMVGIPVFAIIYGGLKLILRFKANDKAIAGFGFMLWFISILILGGIIILEVRDFAITVPIDDTEEVRISGNRTVTIDVANYDDDHISSVYFFDEETDFYMDDEHEDRLYIEPEIRIYHTNDDEISIRVRKEGRGKNNFQAKERAKDIYYRWEVKGSTIYLDPFYYIEGDDKWSFPDVDIHIFIPEGQKVFIDNDLRGRLNYVSRANDIYYSRLFGKEWIMTEDGLDYPENYLED